MWGGESNFDAANVFSENTKRIAPLNTVVIGYGAIYSTLFCRIEQYKPSVNSVICIDLYKKEITM